MLPLSKVLFHRAVRESGAFHPKDAQIGVLATSYRTEARAEELGAVWMTRVGASTIDEARSLSTDALLTGIGDNDSDIPANSNLGGRNPPVWRPVLDGWMPPRTYRDTLRSGRHNDVPVINGNNRTRTARRSLWPSPRRVRVLGRGGLRVTRRRVPRPVPRDR
ncbi:hypothetical protein ABZ281_41290 [Streptomyces sp. NPDC006265]|uniref:hypothetical protein n=1 Tax=Streptomyces sp. NPDC006265 TaxID=3156740 RepID=UPI0033B37585